MTTTTEKAGVEREQLDAPLDDAEPTSERTEQDTSDSDGDDDGTRAPRGRQASTQQNRRQEILNLYREQRDREAEATAEADDDETAADGAGPDAKPAAAVAARPASQPNAPTDDDREVVLKVDGTELRMPLREVIANAQRNLAADARLEEAKRILTEAKAATKARPADQPDDDLEPPATPDQPRSEAARAADQRRAPIGREKLADIVERIQVGSSEDGVAAMEEFIELAAEAGVATDRLKPEQIKGLIDDHLHEQRAQQEASEALGKFAQSFPSIVADTDYAQLTLKVLNDRLAAECMTAGMTEPQLAAIRHNTKALVDEHRRLKRSGHSLSSYDDMLNGPKGVGRYITDKFSRAPQAAAAPNAAPHRDGRAAPDDIGEQRVARKRLNQQPRSSGVRSEIAAAPKPKTTAEVIAEMKKQRHFKRY